MKPEQQSIFSETERMLRAYNTGVTGWRVFDAVATVIVLIFTLSAAALAKFKYWENSGDVVSVLSLLAAIAAGLQKYYRPIEHYRRDWTARGKVQQLYNALRADSDFDAKSSAERLNKIIDEHDKNWV